MLIPCPKHEEFFRRNYCDNCDYAPMHGDPIPLEDLRHHCTTCSRDRINELQQYGLRLEERVKKLEAEAELSDKICRRALDEIDKLTRCVDVSTGDPLELCGKCIACLKLEVEVYEIRFGAEVDSNLAQGVRVKELETEVGDLSREPVPWRLTKRIKKLEAEVDRLHHYKEFVNRYDADKFAKFMDEWADTEEV